MDDGGLVVPLTSKCMLVCKQPGTEPIIIVPSDPSAVINMTNVADFLENAHYVRRILSLLY